MASIKDLKKRIGTVKNTQQTTKAMKMVSAAKLRRAQEAVMSQRPYAKSVGHMIRLVTSLSDQPIDSPLVFATGSADSSATEKSILLVLVTSDRGLCGSFNSNVIKATQRWMAEHQGSYSSIQLACVGRKGYEFFRNRKANIGFYDAALGGKVTFEKAKKLADTLIDFFVSGKVQEVKIIHNEFKNAASQLLVVDEYLPLVPQGLAPQDAASQNAAHGAVEVEGMENSSYLVRPSQPELLKLLLAKNFAIQAFRIMLESQASEHGARMSAMENATKNAGEMIRKLTLQYNKQRQAGITKELLEIISGSESQKA